VTCPCPLTVGQLLVAAAVCATSKAPGAHRVSIVLAEHAKAHTPEPAPKENPE